MKILQKLAQISLSLCMLSTAYAAPIAYIEKVDGTVDFVNSFVNFFDDGAYKVDVILKVSIGDRNIMRFDDKRIDLSDVHTMERVKGVHKLFPEVNEHYGPDKMNDYFVVQTTDGTVYETSTNMPLGQFTRSSGNPVFYTIMPPVPGIKGHEGHRMRYYNDEQVLTTLNNDPKRIVLNDPALVGAKYKEIKQQKEKDIKARAQAEKDKNLANSTFRKSLAVGTITNCGPVIELKGKLIKIYSPVKDYGNEHWLNRDDLYPQGRIQT